MRSIALCLSALLAASAFLGCAATDDPLPSLGEAQQSVDAGAQIFHLVTPIVDAAYVTQKAQPFEIAGTVVDNGTVFSLTDGIRALTVHKKTGGLRYYDYNKYNATDYTVDPALPKLKASTIATKFLNKISLLPSGTTVSEVRAEASPGEGSLPNHWAVSYVRSLPAGQSPSTGKPLNATLKGTVATVFVGNGEVIGLEWDMPTLVASNIVDFTVDVDQLQELTYWYQAFGDNQPFLAPQWVYLGDSMQVVPITTLQPVITLEVPPTAAFIAGKKAALVAGASSGTAPYTFRWEAAIAGGSPILLSTASKFSKVLPPDTSSLTLTLTDANGMSTQEAYPVEKSLVQLATFTTNFPTLAYTAPGNLGKTQSGSKITTTPTLSGNDANWSASVVSTGPGALKLQKIHAHGRLVADEWSLPRLTVKTGKSAIRVCEIGAPGDSCTVKRISSDCWNGTMASPTTSALTAVRSCHNGDNVPVPWSASSTDKFKIPTLAYYNRPFNDNSLVVRNVWEFNSLAAPATDCHLVVAQTYIMEPQVAQWQSCGSLDGNLCSRYYPLIQYWYMDKDMHSFCDVNNDAIEAISFDQKMAMNLADPDPAVSQGDIGLFISDTNDVGPFVPAQGVPLSGFAPLTNEDSYMMVETAPPTVELAVSDPSYMKDNYHERDDSARIFVPGCYGVGDSPSMQCSHMHWNWGGGNKAVTVGPLASANAKYFGAWDGPLAPGSQRVEVSALKYHSGELLTLASTLLQNDEVISTEVTNPGPDDRFYNGTSLVTNIETTCDASAGLNAVKNPGGASKYDQVGLNSYFFE